MRPHSWCCHKEARIRVLNRYYKLDWCPVPIYGPIYAWTTTPTSIKTDVWTFFAGLDPPKEASDVFVHPDACPSSWFAWYIIACLFSWVFLNFLLLFTSSLTLHLAFTRGANNENFREFLRVLYMYSFREMKKKALNLRIETTYYTFLEWKKNE